MSIWLTIYIFGALFTGGSVNYICNDQKVLETAGCAAVGTGAGIVWPVTVGGYLYVMIK